MVWPKIKAASWAISRKAALERHAVGALKTLGPVTTVAIQTREFGHIEIAVHKRSGACKGFGKLGVSV